MGVQSIIVIIRYLNEELFKEFSLPPMNPLKGPTGQIRSAQESYHSIGLCEDIPRHSFKNVVNLSLKI
jgi:hypothetical protein